MRHSSRLGMMFLIHFPKHRISTKTGYREWTKSCLVAWFWYICMLIWDLVKSCLLAKRIGTATFLCIPIVNQFLNNSFVKRIGTAALLHFIPIFYLTFILRHVHAEIRGKLARAIFESRRAIIFEHFVFLVSWDLVQISFISRSVLVHFPVRSTF